LWLIKIIV
jgi:hypothetical protein